MPSRTGLTEKEEQFAHLVVTLGNKTRAHELAYGGNMNAGSRRVQAHHISHKPHVAARIVEIRQEALKKAGLSPEWVVQKHTELFHEAREIGDLTQARRNVRDIGETMGIYKDNLMVTGDLRDISDEELKQRTMAALAECSDPELVKSLAKAMKDAWGKANEGVK